MRGAALDADLGLALELADAADALTLPSFAARDHRVERKPDRTPVTEADRAVERTLRARLSSERPRDVVVGEELGSSGGDGARRWIIDPIDGTRSFLRGVPAWATLIALEVDGVHVLGVVSAPALGRRWWARQGGGAYADGRPIRVSEVDEVADAYVSTDSPHELAAAGLDAAALTERCWRSVGFVDFWGHVLVAEGALDVMIEPGLALWDVAALDPIVSEAGGRLSDQRGRPWREGDGGGECITTNGRLHDAVLDALAARG